MPPLKLLVRQSCAAYLTAVVMGASGTCVNDVCDYDLDRHVARRRNRPIVRGAISPAAAFVFAVSLEILYVVLLCWTFGAQVLPYGILHAISFWMYALSKRVTFYTPVVYGVVLSAPILFATSVLGLDPLRRLAGGQLDAAPTTQVKTLGALFVAHTVMTVIFETVYAYLDVKDDIKAGIKSMAVHFKNSMRELLTVLAVILVGLLIYIGRLSDFATMYYAGCAMIVAILLYLLHGIELQDPKSCAGFFVTIPTYVGGAMVLSLVGEQIQWRFF